MGPCDRSASPGEGRLDVQWLGRLAYAEALALQQSRLEECAAGRRGDSLCLLEHPRVITLGRSARDENLLTDPVELARRGIELHRVARGGDVTVHAPGQLVGYLIARLDRGDGPDLPAMLRRIEAALVAATGELGVAGRTVAGLTGVFVDRERSRSSLGPERKLASIGIGVRRWVSYHGFALNVDLDLDAFADVVPCGLHGVEMTSLDREGARWRGEPMAAARAAVTLAFGRHFA